MIHQQYQTFGNEIEKNANERIKESQEHHALTERRLNVALEGLQHAHLDLDRIQSQLFESSVQAEKRLESLGAANAILAEDLSATNQELANVQAQLHLSQTELNTLKLKNSSDSSSNNSNNNNSNHNDIYNNTKDKDENDATLQSQVTQLQTQLREKDSEIRHERMEKEGAMRELKVCNSKLESVIASHEHELSTRPTREDVIALRRELKVLQRVAFNVEDDLPDGSIIQNNTTNKSNSIDQATKKNLMF